MRLSIGLPAMTGRAAVRHAVFGVLLAGVMSAGPCLAQSGGNTQQERMKACNTQASAKHLSGDARKTFMSDCLSGKTGAAKPLNSQQEKMKTCNAEATGRGLKGDARQQFMSTCLKKK